MNKTVNMILDAIEDGINLELLLRETQLPEDVFRLKLEWGQFDIYEQRDIKRTIKEWRAQL
jgi:hypothetical protein